MRQVAIMTLLAAGIFAGVALAESHFARTATVERVDLQNGFIQVEEGQYRVGYATRVYTSTGSLSSLQTLRPGMAIRFNTGKTTKDWQTITELQIVSGD